MSNNPWDAKTYDSRHSFVWKLAEDLIAMLDPKPGERILDLGCGTGHLTAQIAAAGCDVVGLDVSESMLETARREHPEILFIAEDARAFQFGKPFDGIFTNAALHWIP